MNEKQKIIAIYGSVAVICALLITCFWWLGAQRSKLAAEEANQRLEELAAGQTMQVFPPLTDYDKQITENLKGVNQDSEDVSLFDLKGKVVVFAQFYGSCSMCLGHNRIIMNELHEVLKDNAHVHFVTVTVNPHLDTPDKLKEIAATWGAESKDWWLLNVSDKKVLGDFCRKQLWYKDFSKNEQATGPADEINHDMSIAVIDGDTKLRAKVDLYTPLAKGDKDTYQIKKSQLLDVIHAALKK